ncbi:GNAT family N-acetyltransferase [Blastococcus haudaquaticus]|uniref:Acetyltransferase (GNAT) domain-containing protein n=1 Tax=Blastococcus haudaquaticus TaxID=1938745 RepID=A0A286GYZ2_9ACTN|nr:GNAT family N-acetyltransferase [Blastococcus haudaquaticus]SOE00426.1 Acetyltransferase (GNAT) domain-containing protein [Blastococcus haudaquaticus]
MSRSPSAGHVTRVLERPDAHLIAQWRDLATRAAEANPFAEPDVVVPAMRHLDGRDAALLTVWDGDRLDALLPVRWPMRIPLPGGRWLPLPAWEATTLPYRPLGTPLLDRTRAVDAAAALLRPPVSARRPAAMLGVRAFSDDGPVAAAFDEALAGGGRTVLRLKTYQRAVFLSDSGTTPGKSGRRRYRQVRAAREKLDQQVGVSTILDRSGDPSAVEDFLRLEASGWKGRAGSALACRPEHADWFREMCAGLAAQGRLELLSLRAGGKDLAMECCLLAGEDAFHLKAAYDEAYADYVPGMQPLLHVIDGQGGKAHRRDSCTLPDNALMNSLWPDRRTLSTVLLPLHGAVGGATLGLVRGARRTVGRGRAAVGRLRKRSEA